MKTKNYFSLIAILLFSMISVFGCGRVYENVSFEPNTEMNTEVVSEGQLFAMDIESEEEAKELADIYGIEFVSLLEGVAVYHTDENPQDVIDRGEKEGYKQLYINNVVGIYKAE